MEEMARVLKAIPGVRFCPAERADLMRARMLGRFTLPKEHLNLLAEANGISVFNGYFRLFGLGCSECRDSAQWNAPETWRFAWPESLSGYLFFGETAWGDQYAYSLEDIARGGESVYLLDAFEMEPERIASTFQEFVGDEFVRCARQPYDSMLRAASTKFGPLDWMNQITYIPSLLLGGVETIENVHILNARANMIINGDIARQVSHRSGGAVQQLENYVDEHGRLRVRVLWVGEA